MASYFPISDGSGTGGVGSLVVEVTDVHRARTRAEEAVQRTAFVDAELRALYAALPVGVAFLDPELRYLRVNDTLARMNERPVAEHLGATIEEVLGEAAALVRPMLEQVMATREAVELQVDLPPVAGETAVRALEATYFPVVEGGTELLGIGGVVRDVSGRRQLEVEQSRLLREALTARAEAEAARVRADAEREEAERARADAERARARMSLLAQAGRRMAESMDWESTLEAVVRSAVPAIADWCSLTLVEPGGGLRVLALAHKDAEREALAWRLVERHPPAPDDDTGAARVIRTGEPEVVHDVPREVLAAAAEDDEHLRLLENLNLRHYVIAPLRSSAGISGALTFVLEDADRRFAPEDLQLVTSLAARAALHIQNARLYAERSHIARTLQASLRPRALPEIEGAELAARFLAAGDQNEVGGDFYDVFRSGDAVWTAIVGDVAGKGPEAAAITALARHTLRTASLLEDAPAANLALLNRVLCSDSAPRDFCTVLYARLCPGADGVDLRLANGGHPPPFLLRPDGTVDRVDAGHGPLVGGVEEAVFTEATLTLAPGELLLLYTDGVVEVRTSDPGLGERELRATLARHAGRPADEVVDAVARRAVELQGGGQRDDIAVLAVRATARR
jgi:serine phosphatase RsbU (regulator of sigma subunit)